MRFTRLFVMVVAPGGVALGKPVVAGDAGAVVSSAQIAPAIHRLAAESEG